MHEYYHNGFILQAQNDFFFVFLTCFPGFLCGSIITIIGAVVYPKLIIPQNSPLLLSKTTIAIG